MAATVTAYITFEPFQLIGESSAWITAAQQMATLLSREFSMQVWAALSVVAILTLFVAILAQPYIDTSRVKT
jgi:hypothetical protein